MRASLLCAAFSAILLGGFGFEYKYSEVADLASNPAYYPTNEPYWYNAKQEDALCSHEVSDEIYWGYRHAFYDMSAILYRRIAAVTGNHFVYSPQTSYLTLAAIAEGCTGQTREQLFKLLSLPEDICKREAYYHLATTREHSDTDIVFERNRYFVADSSINVNRNWKEYVKNYLNLNTISIPYKTNPVVEIEGLRKLLKAQLPKLNLNGNSLLLESLDYNALWTSFADAVSEQGPFYNSAGKQVGVVEYMKVTKRANIGFIPSMGMKVIDLPVGREGRYRMYFVIPLKSSETFSKTVENVQSSIVFEIVANMKRSLEPVEIVIPKMKMTSEVDIKQLLEDVGYTSLWIDPLATRNISEPAALPSAFTQRVTITVNEGGVRPPVPEYQNFVPPLQHNPSGNFAKYSINKPPWSFIEYEYDPSELNSFIANRPFLFGLFDSQSLIGLMTGIFSKIN